MSRQIAFWLLLFFSGLLQAATTLTELLIIPEDARQKVPDFVSENLSGGESGSADYKGKVLLLNFWATWCIPCREEMPGMETLWQSYKEQGLVIAAVSVDEGAPRGRLETFSKMFNLSFPVLLDPDSKVSDLYKVSNMPTSFLIDRDGKMISRIVGAVEWSSPEAIQLIEDILSE